MLKQALSALEELGYRGGATSIRHLDELRAEIEAPRRDGLVKEGVYDQYLSSFEWEPPASLPGAKSIFVVAVPDPAVRITFTWREKPVPVIVPPSIYTGATSTGEPNRPRGRLSKAAGTA
jgi:hypothetical protein